MCTWTVKIDKIPMQSLLHFKKQHKFQAQTFKKRWPPISVGLERALNTLETCCRLAGFAARNINI
jgi:hypothetical protein